MKTAEKKAKHLCTRLKLPSSGPAFSAILKTIKEQDRDTRHACAEVVTQCNSPEEAHDACMNAKAV